MSRSKLMVGFAGILLLILGACAQQSGDIAGKAITTLAQFNNRDCAKFALPGNECPTIAGDRATAGLTATEALIVITNPVSAPLDTDNDGDVFTDADGNLVDDDAQLDDKDTPSTADDVILNKDLPPRPLVTVYDDQFTNPADSNFDASAQFNPASDPTNVLGIKLVAQVQLSANPKEVLLVNRVGFVFNRGKARWEAIEWDAAGPTASSYIGAPGNSWLKIAGPGVTVVDIPVKSTTTLVTPAWEAKQTEDDVRFGMFDATGSPADSFFGLAVPGANGVNFARNADYSLGAVMACTCIDDPADLANPRPCTIQRTWDCRSDPNVGNPGGPTRNAFFTVAPFQIAEGNIGVGQVEAPGDTPN